MAVTTRCSDASRVIIFSEPFCSSSVNPYMANAAVFGEHLANVQE